MKVLYFDTETTGLDAAKNDVIQIAGAVEIDGEVKEEFCFFCQPHNWNTVEQSALDIQGRTIEDLKTFGPARKMHGDLIRIFEKYVDRFNKLDKFMPAGQNVRFDIDFMYQFFKKCGDPYFFSWISPIPLDLLPLTTALKFKGIIKPENLKLGTIAAEFGLKFEAHDALEDIRVTRQLINTIVQKHLC